MRTYRQREGERAWLCGHWNGAPIEIGVSDLLTEVPAGESPHHHPYCEFYVGLEGTAEVEIDGVRVTIEPRAVVMVEPGERHHVVSIGADGARWVAIKERSLPNSKFTGEPGEESRRGESNP